MPAVIAPAVIAGALVSPTLAGAAVDLPEKTPEQVLALVAQSSVHQLSGTLEQTSELGLPELPTRGPGSNADVTAALDLLTGTHTARVFLDGPSNARVQVMDALAERDVVRNGADVWLYSSTENSAVHVTLPRKPGTESAPSTVPTPRELADRLLAGLDASTVVKVGADTEVASRTAYRLILEPRVSTTLVGSVSIAVDSETGLPLSVSVAARGQSEPAFELAFTSLSLDRPSADLFTFTPPPGATVKELSPSEHGTSNAPQIPDSQSSQPSVIGTGWDAVVEVPASAIPAELLSSPLLAQATRSFAGGRLLTTALVNVLLTNDGRVFAGSVPPDRLQAAAEGR